MAARQLTLQLLEHERRINAMPSVEILCGFHRWLPKWQSELFGLIGRKSPNDRKAAPERFLRLVLVLELTRVGNAVTVLVQCFYSALKRLYHLPSASAFGGRTNEPFELPV
jgi:hypothetical protein